MIKSHCKKHKCIINNCINAIRNFKTKYCYVHACEYYYCRNEKNLSSANCGKHECIIKDCHNLCCINKETKYCENHKCSFLENIKSLECYNSSLENNIFCLKHKCFKCDNPVWHKKVFCKYGNHIKYIQGNFCDNHTCFIMGSDGNVCMNYRKEDKNICDYHP
jgi:hypothetical protein